MSSTCSKVIEMQPELSVRDAARILPSWSETCLQSVPVGADRLSGRAAPACDQVLLSRSGHRQAGGCRDHRRHGVDSSTQSVKVVVCDVEVLTGWSGWRVRPIRRYGGCLPNLAGGIPRSNRGSHICCSTGWPRSRVGGQRHGMVALDEAGEPGPRDACCGMTTVSRGDAVDAHQRLKAALGLGGCRGRRRWRPYSWRRSGGWLGEPELAARTPPSCCRT